MQKQIVRTALIGIGGFGSCHLNRFLQLQQDNQAKLVAIADPDTDQTHNQRAQAAEAGAAVYDDYLELLETHKNELDLVVIATPPHLHCQMATEAFRRNLNVLLEKPPVVTIQDHDALLEEQRKAGVLCAVGFHMIPSGGVQVLKGLVAKRKLGELRRVVVQTQWKRPNSYFERSPWAGQLRHNDQWVLDGTVMNPLAHSINNALYVISEEPRSYARPVSVMAELYRGHDIASEDTSCARLETDLGIPVHYYGTLCSTENHAPVISIQGSLLTVSVQAGKLVTTLNYKGKKKDYPLDTKEYESYPRLHELVLEAVRHNYLPANVTSLQAARNYTVAANGIFESSAGIQTIEPPHSYPFTDDDGASVTVRSIGQTINEAADQGKLFSEMNVPWSRKTHEVSLEGYDHFSGDAYHG